MKLNVTVCDVCQGVGRATTNYRIKSGDRTVTVDLCIEHGQPIEVLLDENADKSSIGGTGKRRSTGRRHRGTPVATMEEIEARKAKES